MDKEVRRMHEAAKGAVESLNTLRDQLTRLGMFQHARVIEGALMSVGGIVVLSQITRLQTPIRGREKHEI